MKDVAIAGLPFSGKSTVWRAVSRLHAQEAGKRSNVAVVAVPEPRLEQVARILGSSRITPTQVRLIDTPGFEVRALAEARESDALAVVLRGFGDDADPPRDLSEFRSELAVADLATMEAAAERARRQAKSGASEAKAEVGLYERAEEVLSDGRWLREGDWEPEELRRLSLLTPLTLKPVLHVLNADEQGWQGAEVPSPEVEIRGLLEAEASELSEGEAAGLLAEYGLVESATARFVRSVYELLDLVVFFTGNEEQAQAWEVPRGTRAPQAAGRIHSDFERGFIRADAISWEVWAAAGSWERAREQGLVRTEGKDYVVQDGDMLLIRHSR